MNYFEDEELPDLEFPDVSREQSIEEMIAADKKADKDDDDYLNKARKRGNSKRVVIGSIGGAVAVAAVVGVIAFNPFGGDQKQSKAPETVAITTPSPGVGNDKSVSDESFAVDQYIPFKTQPWQNETYDKDTKGLRDSILKHTDGTELDLGSGILPSEDSGFTSDFSKRRTKAGGTNPLYAYWTHEVFEAEVGLITERLLNPVFGDWEIYQWSGLKADTDFPVSIFSDIFRDEMLERNSGKPKSSWVPVFADWNSNDYDDPSLLEFESRWFGKVKSTEVYYDKDEETGKTTAKSTSKVEFTAWHQDQTKVKRTGTLTLDLISNPEKSDTNRVQINDASLVMD